MKREELDVIRKRAEAATPGPWAQINGINVFTELGATNLHGVTADHNDGWCVADTSVGLTTVDGELIEMERSEQFDNATFIANARQDVPALLDEIEYLNGVIGTLVGFFEVARDYPKVTATIIEEALKYGEEELRR